MSGDVKFDADTLRALDDAIEVVIETLRPDGSVRRTIIWVMVDDDEVFARSVRGDRGEWFQAAVESPDDIVIELDGRRVAARAVLATDPVSVERTSRELERKYAGDPDLPPMLVPQVLHTTMRLEPRTSQR